MSKEFDFLYDVGGPNAYLAHKVLPEFCAAHGAQANYVPILLGGVFKATGNRAPLIRYADAPAKMAYEQLEFRRFVDRHQIVFVMNPHFPVNTLLAMRMLAGITDADVAARAIEAAMDGLWSDGLDLSDPAVLAARLDQAGLDGAALVAAAGQQPAKDRLTANTEAAVARGVFGVPSFLVGEELFWGKERLGQLAEELARN